MPLSGIFPFLKYTFPEAPPHGSWTWLCHVVGQLGLSGTSCVHHRTALAFPCRDHSAAPTVSAWAYKLHANPTSSSSLPLCVGLVQSLPFNRTTVIYSNGILIRSSKKHPNKLACLLTSCSDVNVKCSKYLKGFHKERLNNFYCATYDSCSYFIWQVVTAFIFLHTLFCPKYTHRKHHSITL